MPREHAIDSIGVADVQRERVKGVVTLIERVGEGLSRGSRPEELGETDSEPTRPPDPVMIAIGIRWGSKSGAVRSQPAALTGLAAVKRCVR
jgi:hypothetical protein